MEKNKEDTQKMLEQNLLKMQIKTVWPLTLDDTAFWQQQCSKMQK